MKSAAMGVIPFKVNDDLRAQLQTFGAGGGDVDWIEMVRCYLVFGAVWCRHDAAGAYIGLSQLMRR